MNIKSLKSIEEDILKELKVFNVDKYDLSDLRGKIKRNFLRETIKKYNVFNLKKIDLVKEQYTELKSDFEVFNFEEVEKSIKEELAKFSKEDKINEVMPFLNFEKVFNKNKEKYFSLWDFEKEHSSIINEKYVLNVDKLNNTIQDTINNLKEICLSCYGLGDKYRKQEAIKEILEFLKYAYNVEIEIKDLYDKSLKDIEEEINQNKEVKIKLFKEWYYLTFSDKNKQEDFKKRIIKRTQNRFKKR